MGSGLGSGNGVRTAGEPSAAGEAVEGSDEYATPHGADPTPKPDEVFISYRVHPDQRIAAAVKRLIVGALEPAPSVFVSGLGGLRPSSEGFKPQLRAAVQRARAFVGIITAASKDREWIFYEAGAAWGREAIYVPFLVNASTADLPSSIADYDAVNALDRGQVERFLAGLAEQLGCRLRSHFGPRYTAFRRWLDEVKEDRPGDENDQLFSRADLVKRYPGTSGDVECLGDALLVPVPVRVEDWMICTEDEKAAMIYRALDEHEVRS